MVASGRLSVLTVITIFAAVANAQELQEDECAINRCPGNQRCLNRNVTGEPEYVCECTSPREQGFDCSSVPPFTVATYTTCYGSQCSSGSFSSPGYPTFYPARHTALYLIYVPDAVRISFSFSSPFNIEPEKDELYFGPGLQFSVSDLDGFAVADGLFFFDGPVVPRPFSIDSDTVWILFQSDKNIQSNGWQVSWTTENACNSAPCLNGGICTTMGQSYQCRCQEGFSGQDCQIGGGDMTPPVVSGCPANIVETVATGTITRSVSWVEPTATDNSGFAEILVRTHAPGFEFPIRETRVTYVFTDQNNNNEFCSFTVTIAEGGDNIDPVVQSCPMNIAARTVAAGVATLPVQWSEPIVTDNSGTVNLLLQTHMSGDSFPLGPTTVEYVFADAAGNNAICQFTVTITAGDDMTPPVISGCPANIIETAVTGVNTRSVSWVEPTATDNSGFAEILLRTHAPGFEFPIRETRVTYVFTDQNNNNEFCSFTVTITEGGDNIDPVVQSCPMNIARTVAAGVDTLPVQWSEPIVTDNSGTVNLLLQTHMSGDSFPLGPTTVEYVFADATGNNAICQFTVTITAGSDMTPPVISGCPANIIETVATGVNTRSVSWVEPTATDNSGFAEILVRTHAPGFAFPILETRVTYVFTDQNNNNEFCSFTVTITEGGDNIDPVVQSCPMNIARTVAPGVATLPVQWSEPIVTDNSGTVNLLVQTHMSGDNFPLGPTIVDYVFADSAGNNAICQFTVTITAGTSGDTTGPTIIMEPGPITETAEIPETMAPVYWIAPTAVDSSGPVSIVFQSHRPGDEFLIGTTPVTYTFQDGVGNPTTVTFDVTVVPGDMTPPVVDDVPENVPGTVEIGTPTTPVFWPEPTATDNSGIATLLSQSHSSGDSFPVGTTPVTYVYSDPSGNEQTVTFDVVVTRVDSTRPTIENCPSSITRTIAPGGTSLAVEWTEPTVTDVSGMVNLVLQTHISGQQFIVTTTQVTYVYANANNNNVFCQFEVTVKTGDLDNSGPTITNAPGTIVTTIEVPDDMAMVSWPEIVATDPSSPVTIVFQSHQPGDVFPEGTTQVTYIFEDSEGNPTTVNFDVVVNPTDTIRPVADNVPGDIRATTEGGSGTMSVHWSVPTATDNSGIATLVSQTHSPGDTFRIGTTPVTYVFRDPTGNERVVNFDVTIEPGDIFGPTIVSSPGNIIATPELGSPTDTAQVFWAEPTAVDSSEPVTITFQSHRPGDEFLVGTTPVTYIFSDGVGNPTEVMFNVIVTPADRTPPTISNCPAPSSIQRTIELGSPGVTVVWQEPTATDLSLPVTVVRSPIPGATFLPGVTPVSYTFTDAGGNIATCIFTVTVSQTDTVRPSVSNCPSNIVEVIELGISSAFITWSEPSATDISGEVAVTRTAAPNSQFPVDTTTVTYTFTDASGNIALCEFDVTVMQTDTTPPIVQNCPGNLMDVTELGTPGTPITWQEPTAFDISGRVTLVTQSHQSGTVFPVGETAVVYTFVDSSGNPNDCRFTITIVTEDTIPPTISNCPSDIEESIELGLSTVIVSWTEPTATDLSGIVTLTTRSDMPGTPFLLGTTRVVYIFSDSSNLNSICSFDIIVMNVDTTPPVISDCPTNINEVIELGLTSRVVSWVEPTATDLSGQATITSQSHFPGTAFPVTATLVTYRFTDASGINAMCSFVVTITTVDRTPPTISNCPSNIVEVVELGAERIPVSWIPPTATDVSGMVSVVRSHEPNSLFEVTSTTVTYTFRDLTGNDDMCQFVVTVISEDTTPPTVLNCPSNLMGITELGTAGTVISWQEPSAVDISNNVQLTTQSHQPNTEFRIGETEVSYVFTDGSGNIGRCMFTVIITTEDTTKPTVLNCPGNIIMDIELGLGMMVVAWSEPIATDISGVANLVAQTSAPGDRFPPGPTAVTYIYSDNSNNRELCSFNVILNEVDTTPPTILSVPSNPSATLELGLSSRVPVTWEEPTATDLSLPVTIISQTNRPNDLFPVGRTPVTYTFVDAVGNESPITFNVDVLPVDTIPPVVTNVPNDITETVEVGVAEEVSVVWPPLIVSDLSGRPVTLVSQSNSPGDPFPIGTTPVTYEYQDAAGNPTTVSFDVTVIPVDTTPPIVVNVPGPQTVTIELGTGSEAPVTWTPPTAFDASGTPTVTSTDNPGDPFPIGTTPVTYTFVDSSGNPTEVTFDVNVIPVDTTGPTILNPPGTIPATAEVPITMVPATWPDLIATDPSGPITTVFQSHQPGDLFPLGINPVTYIFEDSDGNPTTVTFNVVVTPIDTTGPTVINPPSTIPATAERPANMVPVTWPPIIAADPSGPVTIAFQSHQPGDQFPLGSTPVRYIFEDPAGNPTTVIFDVVVTPIDTTPPVITNVPSSVPATIELGTSSMTPVFWPEPTAVDNSGMVSQVSQSNTPGDLFSIGTTPVTYVYRDPSGNPTTVSFNVVITEVDTTPPTILQCPNTIAATTLDTTGGAVVSWPTPTAIDASGTAVLTQSHQSSSFFPTGTTTVRITFTDSSGNPTNCFFDVIVNEVDPCTNNQCQNGAACVATSQTTFICVCPDECYTGMFCEVALDACTVNQCSNGAACRPVAGSCTQYTCECPPCFTGPFCNTPLDACLNNQCQNGGQCVQDGSCTTYRCECPACFTGEFCEQVYNACDDSSCLNGGVCTNVGLTCTEYTCNCPSCFTGAFCEIGKVACNPSPCQNNGICSSSAFDDSCFAYSCRCVGCYTGFNCEIAITPACSSSPCTNGGVCSNVPGTCSGFTCDCPPGYSGVRCEDASPSNINPCNSSPCERGSTCLVMDGPYYLCVCRPGYSGINCGDPVPDNVVQDPCGSNPCENGATCRASYNSLSSPQGFYIPQYTCICQPGNTGANCNLGTATIPTLDICNMNNRPDCDNGATCSNAYHSYDQDVDYYCNCQPGFIGHNCDIVVADPCASDPCQNDAACFSFTTYYMCMCQSGYTGTTCEDINSSDSTGPTIVNCPTDPLTIVLTTGSEIPVSWPELFAFDPSTPVETVYQSHQPGAMFREGTTTVSYVFRDRFFNPSICMFAVIVSVSPTTPDDTIPPVITGCPTSDITATLPQGATSTPVSWVEPVATDNSQAQPRLTRSHIPGQSFIQGPTRVSYLFTDAANNPALCTFDVVVQPSSTADTIPPVITGCPTSDITATLPQGATSTPVSWVEPVATDNSQAQPSLTRSHIPGQSFIQGPTTVTYLFLDAANNPALCVFNVVVVQSSTDNIRPVISNCPGNIERTLGAGMVASISWNAPTATDNSGRVTVDGPPSPSGVYPVGQTTTITYRFTDPSGNFAECSFDIILTSTTQVDNEDPVISNCPDTIFRQIPNGSPGETVFWTEPTATDNLDTSLTLVRSDAPGDFFIPGNTPVTYTFTDDAGRSAMCSFSVFIFVSGVPTDNEDPVISNCPDSIVRQLPNGSPGQTIFWVEPTATDNLDTSLTLVRSHAPGDFFIPGNTPVTYTFTDDAGRSAMCSFSVFIFVSGVITDSTPPEITGCPSQPITRIISSALDSGTVEWMAPTATDASGAVEIIPSHSSGDEFFVGTTEVTYTFRDDTNNEADCSFDVIVERGSYPCAGSPCPPELACFYSPTEFACRERDGSLRRRREVIDAGNGPCPCQNGGSCHQDGERDGQYCACPPGYSGFFCQLK